MAVKSSLINMVACLGAITLVCSALLGVFHEITADPIQKAAEAKTQQAIAAVLPPFESLSELREVEGGSYYLAYDAEGEVVGVAINTKSSGFGGAIRMMVGFYPDGRIYNTSVLEHAETPGLGAKCTEESFAGQFRDFDPSVSNLTVTNDGGDINAITAATITSRAYCVAIDNAVKMFQTAAATPMPCDCEECGETNEEGQSNE